MTVFVSKTLAQTAQNDATPGKSSNNIMSSMIKFCCGRNSSRSSRSSGRKVGFKMFLLPIVAAFMWMTLLGASSQQRPRQDQLRGSAVNCNVDPGRFSLSVFKHDGYVKGSYEKLTMLEFAKQLQNHPVFFIRDFKQAVMQMDHRTQTDKKVMILFPKVNQSNANLTKCEFVVQRYESLRDHVDANAFHNQSLRERKNGEGQLPLARAFNKTVTLVSPTWPKENGRVPDVFRHVGPFMFDENRALHSYRQAVWKTVGATVIEKLSDEQEVHLNTHGSLPWLHVRVQPHADKWTNPDDYFQDTNYQQQQQLQQQQLRPQQQQASIWTNADAYFQDTRYQQQQQQPQQQQQLRPQQQQIRPSAEFGFSVSKHDRYVKGSYANLTMQEFAERLQQHPVFFIRDFKQAVMEMDNRTQRDYKVMLLFPKVNQSNANLTKCEFVVQRYESLRDHVDPSQFSNQSLREPKNTDPEGQLPLARTFNKTNTLVVPTYPKSEDLPDVFRHVGPFMFDNNRALHRYRQAVWKMVGATMIKKLNQGIDVHLNTHGALPWLHVRVEPRAQYWPNSDAYFS